MVDGEKQWYPLDVSQNGVVEPEQEASSDQIRVNGLWVLNIMWKLELRSCGLFGVGCNWLGLQYIFPLWSMLKFFVFLLESKRFKAVVIRIESPGDDAFASNLMWREIRLLAASKPFSASTADVVISGGYYMQWQHGL
ncbi:unnamed protein product [Camellia sinensis]